eukprot:6196414-Pleurochrysis_carterae.AAC.3
MCAEQEGSEKREDGYRERDSRYEESKARGGGEGSDGTYWRMRDDNTRLWANIRNGDRQAKLSDEGWTARRSRKRCGVGECAREGNEGGSE